MKTKIKNNWAFVLLLCFVLAILLGTVVITAEHPQAFAFVFLLGHLIKLWSALHCP